MHHVQAPSCAPFTLRMHTCTGGVLEQHQVGSNIRRHASRCHRPTLARQHGAPRCPPRVFVCVRTTTLRAAPPTRSPPTPPPDGSSPLPSVPQPLPHQQGSLGRTDENIARHCEMIIFSPAQWPRFQVSWRLAANASPPLPAPQMDSLATLSVPQSAGQSPSPFTCLAPWMDSPFSAAVSWVAPSWGLRMPSPPPPAGGRGGVQSAGWLPPGG